MENLYPAIAIVLFSIIISRILKNKALKKLSGQKKTELVEVFSKYRQYSTISILIILTIYMGLMKFGTFSPITLTISYYAVFVAYLVVISIVSYSILKKNAFELSFIQIYMLANIIMYLGIIATLVLLMRNML